MPGVPWLQRCLVRQQPCCRAVPLLWLPPALLLWLPDALPALLLLLRPLPLQSLLVPTAPLLWLPVWLLWLLAALPAAHLLQPLLPVPLPLQAGLHVRLRWQQQQRRVPSTLLVAARQ